MIRTTLVTTFALASILSGCGDPPCTDTATCPSHDGGGGEGAGAAGGTASAGGHGGIPGTGGGGAGGGTGGTAGSGGEPPEPGEVIWENSFGDAAADNVTGAALTADGGIVLAGSFEGALDFGGGALVSGGGEDVFVAKLDPSGNRLWANQYGGINHQRATSVAVDSADNVVVLGEFDAPNIDLGTGALTAAGASDLFVARLSTSGAPTWSTRVGGNGALERAALVRIAPTTTAIITGRFQDSITFGNTTLTSPYQQAGAGFIAGLSSANGQHQYSKGALQSRYGHDVTPAALALDTAGTSRSGSTCLGRSQDR